MHRRSGTDPTLPPGAAKGRARESRARGKRGAAPLFVVAGSEAGSRGGGAWGARRGRRSVRRRGGGPAAAMLMRGRSEAEVEWSGGENPHRGVRA